jgi:hypothetical protein
MPERHGDTNGTVIHNGYIVAEFGDTSHVDVTYSVARGYVASLLGLCPIQDF